MGFIDFTKSHGLGNDFIIINNLDGRLDLTEGMVRAICDRHFGVGADGLMLVGKAADADYFMDFRNSDGSIAEMCGNGIRAFAKYIYDNVEAKGSLKIATRAGVKTVELVLRERAVESARVDMGEPGLASEQVPVRTAAESFIGQPLVVRETEYIATCVSMGNPHTVIFVDDLEAVDILVVGPAIESMDIFPRRTNVEFAQVTGSGRIRVVVWERGVGLTLACGTGACATLVAAHINNLAPRDAVVALPGGELSVTWRPDNHVILAGPVEQVFTGRLDIDNLLLEGERD